ncbi:MAG TPA: metal ABC transporter permease [Nitrososphaera sp.]|nr:metal ABC transporter permease [Nitrososphaera sp.]
MYITLDEEQARVSGLQISKLNYLFIILTSVAVIGSMRFVGGITCLVTFGNSKHYSAFI